MATHGLEISSLAYYPNNLAGDDAAREEANAHLRKVIDAAAALEVGIVGTFAGADQTLPLPENLQRFRTVWPPLVEYAEERGVKIAIENCPMIFSWDEWPSGQNIAYSPAVWDEMFDAIPSESFGLNLDPSHLVWLQIDYERVVYDYASRIIHVHAKDLEIRRDGLHRHGTASLGMGWQVPRLPGLGEVRWDRFIAALYAVGYDFVVSIEHEDRELRGHRGARQARLPALPQRLAAPAGLGHGTAAGEQLVVDVAPGDDEYDRAVGVEPGKGRERRGCRCLHPDARVVEGDDGCSDVGLGHFDHQVRGCEQPLDGHGNGDPHGEPVRDRVAEIAVDRTARSPRPGHDRCAGRDDAHAPRVRRTSPECAAHAGKQRTVAHGHHDGRGCFAELVDDLLADRRVAVELRLLGAVLEERLTNARRILGRLLLGLVDVGAGLDDLSPEPRQLSELRAARLPRNEHRRGQPETRCRPGSRGAVIAGGGRHDAGRAIAPVPLEGRQRAAPLERAELVDVLSLEVDVVTACEGRWRDLEGSCSHEP